MKDYSNVNEKIRIKIKEIRELKLKNPSAGKKAEDELIMSLAYIVHSVVFRYKRFDNYEDLYQEGMIGLIKAVQNYNTDMSFHFTRYAIWWIRARVSRSIKKLKLMKISGDDTKYIVNREVKETDCIDEMTPENNSILIQQIENMGAKIKKLPWLHQEILIMRFGLNNTKSCNLQDIGNRFNMTREGIRQLETRILNSLKTIMK